MQEQIPSNITPEQGWSMMKTILDREMPARKNARRIPLFWWSTAVILIVGLSGFVMMINKNATFPPAYPAQQQTPVTPEKPVEQKDNAQEEKIYAEADNSAGESLKKANSNNFSNNHEAFSANESLKDKLNKSKSSGNPIIAETDLWKHAQANIFPAENSLVETRSSTDDLVIHGTIDDVNSLNGLASTDAIPVLPFNAFETAEPTVEKVEPNMITPKKKRKTSFSPNVELASLTGSGGTGISLGLGLDAAVTPRITVGGSVGYRSFDPSNAFLGIGGHKQYDNASLESNRIIQDDGYNYDVPGFYVAAESLPFAGYSEVDPVVENLHQWQSQLGLSYKLSNKFSMEAGVGVSFNTKAYSEFPIVQQMLDGTNNISKSFNDYNLVRQSNTSYYAGITYHVTKHISLKAQWWQTDQSYLTLENTSFITGAPSVDRDDYIRGLNVGVKYSIL